MIKILILEHDEKLDFVPFELIATQDLIIQKISNKFKILKNRMSDQDVILSKSELLWIINTDYLK